MSDEISKKKVAGIIHNSEGDNKGSGESTKRGIFGKLGAYFSSHWVSSAIIAPVVFVVCLVLLFSIRGKGGKE